MTRNIFINFPVEDLNQSMTFFRDLGFEFNSQFTSEQGACMVIEQNIFAMLLTEPFFQTFTPKPVSDALKSTEVLLCLSCHSREEVDEYVAKAVEAGGTNFRPAKDHGFMYQHAFQDLDGHIWELMYMQPTSPEEEEEG